ncbi:MAG: hypothetical protein KF693_15340 [Nitrospira sp.]|nr:hypothetical protein [Nitrospira sp.]
MIIEIIHIIVCAVVEAEDHPTRSRAWLVTYNEHWLVDCHGFSAWAQSVQAMGSGIIVAWTCQFSAVYFRCMGLRRHTAVLIAYSLVVSLHVSIALATELVREEPIPIQTILANPQAFNMRVVRLQGTITTLQVIPGGGGCQGQGIHDAYVFILTDHTGELQIFDRGQCLGTAKSRLHAVKPQMTEFAAGDSVEVVIDVSLLHSPNFDARSLEGALRWIKRISPE